MAAKRHASAAVIADLARQKQEGQLQAIESALVDNADTVRWKVRALRVGTLFAIVGILVMSASLIYSVTSTTSNKPAPVKKGGSK